MWKSYTPEYRCWAALKNRCLNPNNVMYPYYGGRGISICERWLNFDNFLADVGPRPTRKHSIDRYPDNDGNYEPGNVRWATRRQQIENRRSTIFVKFRGKKIPLMEACRILKLANNAVWMRIQRGQTPEEAISTPVRSYKKRSK